MTLDYSTPLSCCGLISIRCVVSVSYHRFCIISTEALLIKEFKSDVNYKQESLWEPSVQIKCVEYLQLSQG